MRRFFTKKRLLAGCVLCMLVVVLALTVSIFDELWGLGEKGGSGESLENSEENAESAAADDEAEKASQAVETAADGNWGLSFQEKGKSPIGNATSDYLKQFDAYYIGDEDGKSAESKDEKESGGSIYLTFDVGYENGYTAGILDSLKAEGVPAAFFVVGNFVEENPELVKRMTDEGHIVGNHTMHHPDMSAISDEASFVKEMNELESAYEKATGEKMLKFYRPPQGKYSESNLRMAKDMGYTTVFWSLAYVDWLQYKQPSREDALNLLNERIHEGAIVLLHSTSKTNSQILPELIQGWKAKGYTFRPLTQLGKDSADADICKN